MIVFFHDLITLPTHHKTPLHKIISLKVIFKEEGMLAYVEGFRRQEFIKAVS
jgi:isocitrate lyase